MTKPKALIIDDEQDICDLIDISLSRMNIETKQAYTFEQALELLQNHQFQLCFTDMRLPDGDGLDILKFIQEHQPNLPVAVITAHGTMDSAILALKRGAFDFVSKPIDLQLLRDLATTALKLNQQQGNASGKILGDSKVIQELQSTINKVSRSQAPVYISGPSGSGKELVARIIHESSARSDQSFVPVNCGAIPKELMESEFFGHQKGSFTGAHQSKPGLFHAAHRGTLFLDEVADLPMDMQVKLLRAIQEKSIRPIGASKEETVDVRILSATHQNLHELVKKNLFREDLFYRLNVIEIKVPSLKEHPEDIPLLADHILKRLAHEQNQTAPQLSLEAIKALNRYSFPGNVRELENILERAFALSEEAVIGVDDLGLPHMDNPVALEHRPLEDYLENVEREAIKKALQKTQGNKSKAAQHLGISFRALRYRLKKLNLE